MKLLLLPLLAALALPSAVNAETWYLLGSTSGGRNWKVPMPNKEQCESAGQRFLNNKNRDDWNGFIPSSPAYICLKGKWMKRLLLCTAIFNTIDSRSK